jgi:hypothetical protein
MTEGWHDDEYLVLFDEDEVEVITERYGLRRFINGFQIVGLWGWDDFILRRDDGKLFTMPTVPIDQQHLKMLNPAIDCQKLKADESLSGKVKWYSQPLIFGGDAQSAENVTWIDHQQHAAAVQWWNGKYQEALTGKNR